MNARREFLLAAALLAAAPFASRAAGAPLKIATVGAGHIGGTLGGLWLKAGHPVFFSSRHPEELHDLVNRLGPLAQAGGVADAIAFADVVLLAVPYRALPQIGKEHAAALAAKLLVLDACNPFESRDGEIAVWARKRGVGLATAEILPGARLVRAFNAISYARLPELARQGGVGMPIAGDDAIAIDAVSGLIREIGLEPVLIGPLAMGRHLVPGTPLAGEHTPAEIRSIAATLK
jgi:8-hydroxy-5-deazaflavin:NADPH oxidoreductase